MSQNSADKISNESAPLYEFAEFSFDAKDKVLFKSGEIIQLAPKACELLGVLIENAGKIVGKDELMNRVWADSFVEEANLTHHISALRKALGEDKNGRKFIETIPRKGYRFIAPISEINNGAAEITISERVTTHAIEEVEIQTDAVEQKRADENQPLLESAQKTLPEFQERKSARRRFSVIVSVLLFGALIGAAIFVGKYWVLPRTNQLTVTPQNITFKRLTPDVYAFDAAGAPDGKSFAYVLFESSLQQLVWQKNLTTGEQSQILPAVEAKNIDYSFLRYSPDGAWLYYCQEVYDSGSEKKGGIYRIPAAGGTPQLIAAQNEFFDYGISPDGGEIAFIRDNGIRVVIVKTDGSGNERVIAEKDGQKQGFTTDFGTVPTWSPDGKHLVVSAGVIKQGREIDQLIDIEVETGNAKALPIAPAILFTQLEWLADGSGLIGLAYEGESLPHQIKFISYPDGKVSSLTNDDNDYIVIRLSKDNRSIFASKNMGARNLWITPAGDFSQRKQITLGSAAKHGAYGIALTKNGKIIYTSTQSGSLDLWEISEDGSGQKQLTVNAGKYNVHPKITPDGRYIVFVSNRSGRKQVWRMDADGRNPIQLSLSDQQTSSASLDDISPDGNWVYFTSFRAENNECNSFKVSIEGGENIIEESKPGCSNRLFSPDGKYLFYRFYGKSDAAGELSLTETASSKKLALPENFSPLNMQWSGDSKTVYFTDFYTRLAKFDVADPKVQTVFDANPNSFASFAITPDNQKIIFSLGNFTNEVVLIENFQSGETK